MYSLLIVNLFFALVINYISEGGIVVAMHPLEIAGKDVEQWFETYQPPLK